MKTAHPSWSLDQASFCAFSKLFFLIAKSRIGAGNALVASPWNPRLGGISVTSEMVTVACSDL